MSLRFNCTGTLGLNDINSDKPFVRKGKTKSGVDYLSFNGSIVAAKNNRMFTELFGMVRDKIVYKDENKTDCEIAWEDRNDPSVLKAMPSYKKFVANIDGSRCEFATEYDLISYVLDNAETLTGKKVTVTGNVQKNVYQGSVSNRFVIQNIYSADEDVKNKLQLSGMCFWQADDVDLADWKSEKKITINAYTSDYYNDSASGVKGNFYFPQTLVFDASKIDFENEKHVKLLNYKLKQLGLSLDGDKIKNNLKSGVVYQLGLVISYSNGAEEVEFDESQLTKNQKEAIELGLKTIDDFRPAGSIYGNRVVTYKIVDFDLRGDGENGVYASDIKPAEFEEAIFVNNEPKQESIDDIVEKAENSDDDDDIDLFN